MLTLTMIVKAFLSLLFWFAFCAEAQEWSYHGENGPEMWPVLFEQCGGANQSPINIDKRKVKINPNLSEITFIGYEKSLPGATITNNGHTAQISPNQQDYYAIQGGGLNGTYRLLNLHFHWGSTPAQGSEHTIDNRRYPLEAHLVHMNEKYSTFNQALNQTDGLAVLSVLFQVSASPNPVMETVSVALETVKYANTSAPFELRIPIPLKALLPWYTSTYIQYFGSLTTPECNEVVTWIIFMKMQKITLVQLYRFVSLMETPEDSEEKAHLVDNFRPLQDIGNRVILGSKCFRPYI